MREMRSYIRCAASALVLLLLLGGAEGLWACNACKERGTLPCRLHRPPTEFKLLHSHWLEYTCCHGLGFRPCPKCKPAPPREALEKQRSKLEAWVRARRTDVEAVLFGDRSSLMAHLVGAPVRHAESENFRLVANIRPLPVKCFHVPEGLFKGLPSRSPQKKKFSPEHYDWINLKRSEDVLRKFKEIFKNQGSFRSAATNYYKDIFKAAEGKYDVFLWNRVDLHRTCARKFFGAEDELGVYKHGARLTTAVGVDEYTRNDESIYRYLVHMVSHLCIEAYDHEIGYDFPSWIPEGFSHYMESLFFGDFKITCYWELKTPIRIPKKVREKVLALVATGTYHPAATLIKMAYNTMDQKAHIQIWSLFHYLVEATPREKFIKFLRELKRTRNQLEAFKTAYGYSLILIDDPWMEFVRKNYGKKKR
jgi:hypothetical protein